MEDKEIALQKKAEIICSGKLFIPRDISLPFPTSKSSAGPDAGKESIVISFSGMRVKVPISRTDGNLELRARNNFYEILKDGRLFLSSVSLLPTLCHAPGQAFVALDRACRMNCLFCTINDNVLSKKGEMTVDRAFELILSASKRADLRAVAVTGGVPRTIGEHIENICALVKKVREAFSEIPIGVEPLVGSREHISMLRRSGATEIKVNIETATKEIFQKVCPNRDYDEAIQGVKWAVEEFGRNRVTSNVIIGLGESDADVSRTIEMLADIGAVANLRAIRIDDANRERLSKALDIEIGISHERLLRLSWIQNEIFRRRDLHPEIFKTMCFACGCCDIVPGVDY